MIHYQFSYQNPHKHFIDVSITVSTNSEDILTFQLPAWRPGRYELANFSKNIHRFKAFDENGKSLYFKKVNKDSWSVFSKGTSSVSVLYTYYANTLDAGSTYLDEHQLYVNPVNCCMFIVGRENETSSIELHIPTDFKVACGLKTNANGHLIADSYDHLAESPFIASNSLLYDSYEVDGIIFHLWIQGKCQPEFDKIKNDFRAFSKTQINSFESFPVSDYHFLFQITPYTSYHGVEHTNSTVILMGDTNDVFQSKYNQILGICSHELYHTWNIKAIRPKELMPYDYTKENYTRLGYVAEGVTTYMGDLMLKKANVFSWEQFISTQNENLKRHYENDGRHNLSVADSSFDTWLDGYQLGIPNRKTSIYADGALTMLMIDLFIIEHSLGKQSLSTVMNTLYSNFKHSGYTEDDFKKLCVELGGSKVQSVFNDHIYGTKDYTDSLTDALAVVGFELGKIENPSLSAKQFGFITVVQNGKHVIKKIQNNSEADFKKLSVEDELISINNVPTKNEKINELLSRNSDSVSVEIKKRFETISVELNIGNYYTLYVMRKKNHLSEKQAHYRSYWAN